MTRKETSRSGAGRVGGLQATALGLSVGVALAVFVLAPDVAAAAGSPTISLLLVQG